MRLIRLLVVLTSTIGLVVPARADGVATNIRTGPDGGRIVRIPDSVNAHCINYTRDSVTLYLRRVITDNKKGWFTNDKEHGVLIKTSPNGKTGGTNGPMVSFPTLSKVQVESYAQGQVYLPLEFPVVDRLKLTQGMNSYDGLNLDVALIRERGRNSWGAALQAMAENMAKLPIPASPYSQAASELLKFANSSVDKSLAESNAPDHLSFAQIALKFGSTEATATQQCPGDDEQTGTIAVIEAGGAPGGGYVSNLSDIDSGKACVAAKLKPGYTLLVKQQGAGACPTDLTQYVQLTNNYLMFWLSYDREAETKKGFFFGVQTIKPAESDTFDRCVANDVPDAECKKLSLR